MCENQILFQLLYRNIQNLKNYLKIQSKNLNCIQSRLIAGN